MEDESMSYVRPPRRRSGSPKSVPVLITLRPISRNIASTSFHFSPLKDTAVTRETRWLVFMVYLKNLKICLTCGEAAKNFLTWTKYLDDAVVWSRKDVIALASFTFKDKKTGKCFVTTAGVRLFMSHVCAWPPLRKSINDVSLCT